MTIEPGQPRPWRRPVRLFIVSGFVWQLCWSSYWTMFFVRVVVDVGLSPLELVLLGTAKEITILLVEIPTGVVADLLSRRLSVIVAFVVCGGAVVGAGLAGGFVALAVTQVVWAFGTTFRSGAEIAWFTDELGSIDGVDSLLPRRGRFEAAGSILGVMGFAVLASVVGTSVTLVCIGIVLVAWGMVLIARMPETGFKPGRSSTRTQLRTIVSEGLQASRQPSLRILLGVTVMTGFASEAVDRLNVARLAEIGLPETVDVSLLFGAAVVAQSVAAILALVAFGHRLAGDRLVAALAVLNMLTSVGVFLLAGPPLLALALVGIVVQGTMRSVAQTVTIAWTNHFTDRSNRATVHSFTGQAKSFGEITGGLVLGPVAQSAGLSTALGASAALYFLASVMGRRARATWPGPDVR